MILQTCRGIHQVYEERKQNRMPRKYVIHSLITRAHVAWWLRHYATNRKVAGSIPDEVIF
jgi:hypothetical protein